MISTDRLRSPSRQTQTATPLRRCRRDFSSPPRSTSHPPHPFLHPPRSRFASPPATGRTPVRRVFSSPVHADDPTPHRPNVSFHQVTRGVRRFQPSGHGVREKREVSDVCVTGRHLSQYRHRSRAASPHEVNRNCMTSEVGRHNARIPSCRPAEHSYDLPPREVPYLCPAHHP